MSKWTWHDNGEGYHWYELAAGERTLRVYCTVEAKVDHWLASVSVNDLWVWREVFNALEAAQAAAVAHARALLTAALAALPT